MRDIEPTLPTMQLHHQQPSGRFGVMLIAANVACSVEPAAEMMASSRQTDSFQLRLEFGTKYLTSVINTLTGAEILLQKCCLLMKANKKVIQLNDVSVSQLVNLI